MRNKVLQLKRATLDSAAAPHMAADAWDEGYRAGMSDYDYETENPYRKAAKA